MKIAHFSHFYPQLTGLYETTREIVVEEVRSGLDAGLIDTRKGSVGKPYQHDRGLITKKLAWANDADLCVLHSLIPEPYHSDKKKKKVMIMHGTPWDCFWSELFENKKPFSTLLDYIEKDLFEAYITLWPRHVSFWESLIDKKKIYYVNSPVNLDNFKPEGPKFKFKNPGFPNVVYCDTWRIDKNPFHILQAFRIFKQEFKKAKLHIFAEPTNPNPVWKRFFDRFDKTNKDLGVIIGDRNNMVKNLSEVYRAADFVVTTQADESRILRECLASGTPLVAGDNCSHTPYQANHYYPEDYALSMKTCFNDILADKANISKKCRETAENNFDVKITVQKFKTIFEEIIKC